MTREQALTELDTILNGANQGDAENQHHSADWVLCELLRTLGYGDVVEAWDKIPKWYA